MRGGRRVVVTGVGTVTAAGIGTDALWRTLLAPVPAGHRPLADWDPSPWLSPAEIRHTDRVTQLAVAAASSAVDEETRTAADPERAAVVLGTALAGVATMERQTVVRETRGDRRVSPFVVPMMMPNAPAAAVSQRLGWRGPCETLTTACASGAHAIAAAARMIAAGSCDIAVAGGVEAAMTGTVMAGFRNMRALSPTGRTRPFDVDRDGFVIAEAAAVLVLQARDPTLAPVWGEILGAASTVDAYDVTMPRPDGADAARCISLALREARVAIDEVGQVNAHGTGTKQGDLAEARAIGAVFGTACPPVTAAKGATGHAFGASAAVEVAAVLLSMRHRLIPPVQGLGAVDPAVDLDLVSGRPRFWPAGPTVSNSFGFGGHNCCLVLGPGA